jgi:hypothetical protein
LLARGRRCGTSERQAIPASDWTDLDWLEDPAISADTVGGRIENAPKYDGVSVSGQRVREIWPPLEEVPAEEFRRADWNVEHAVLWIAYRNPALFHFLGSSSPRAKAQFSIAERRVSTPGEALLEALRKGDLRAIRNGKEIPPLQWFGRRLPERQPEERSYYFRRSDVQEVFRDEPLVAASAKKVSDATRLLARHLRDNPNLKRSDAWLFLKNAGSIISGRGFQSDVWPDAREQAGLPRSAPPGRRKKSPH